MTPENWCRLIHDPDKRLHTRYESRKLAIVSDLQETIRIICAEPRTPLKLATVGMGPSKRSSAKVGRKTDAIAEANNDHC
jgi:hypothetical protein